MENLSFCTALGFSPGGGAVLSAVGGGGKTTMLTRLAGELASAGHTAILTTTTHIMRPSREQMETVADGDLDRVRALLGRKGTVCVGGGGGEKLTAPDEKTLLGLRDLADALLVEADGAKGLSVKAPAPHEPVLYPGSDLVVAVAGLSALGRALKDCCFRLPYVTGLLDAAEDAILTPSLLSRLLTSELGGRKGVLPSSRFTVLLNQADNAPLTALGAETACHIGALLPECRVVITALLKGIDIKAVVC